MAEDTERAPMIEARRPAAPVEHAHECACCDRKFTDGGDQCTGCGDVACGECVWMHWVDGECEPCWEGDDA